MKQIDGLLTRTRIDYSMRCATIRQDYDAGWYEANQEVQNETVQFI